MEHPIIRQVDVESAAMTTVKKMAQELFAYVSSNGVLMPFCENAEELWIKSIEKAIDGKFGILFGAFTGSSIVGFVHCMIRFAPGYLGGHKVGYVSQLYVNPNHRKNSLGKLLMDEAENWFAGKNVHSFELLVHYTNLKSIQFYKKLGYSEELLQMRKFPTKK